MRAPYRNIVFVLVGALGFILKRFYAGPFEKAVHTYGGNFFGSFAVYFLATLLPMPDKFRKWMPAVLSLVVLELYQLFSGFEMAQNLQEPWEFVANAVGVAIAFGVDTVLGAGTARSAAQGGPQAGARA